MCTVYTLVYIYIQFRAAFARKLNVNIVHKQVVNTRHTYMYIYNNMNNMADFDPSIVCYQSIEIFSKIIFNKKFRSTNKLVIVYIVRLHIIYEYNAVLGIHLYDIHYIPIKPCIDKIPDTYRRRYFTWYMGI